MTKHLYFYLEDLSLTTIQRNTLINAVRNYGEENNSVFPHRKMQVRTRLDGKAAIFEAVFQDNQLTAEHFQQILAGIFGVPAANITFTITVPVYGTLVTYSYNTTPRLRFGVFGGINATWEQSRATAHTYLLANQAAWEV
jgi:hypothetical protein